jgi:Domain of unknown function (DUF4386)
MPHSPRPYQALAGAALLAGMVLLWTGSVIHYGQGDPNDAQALLADAHAYPGANLAKAATDVASMTCFLLGGIGLAAIVRGRGRGATITAVVLLALGAPSHVLGASFWLTLIKVTNAGLTTGEETRVATQLINLVNIYFLGLIPFLLALLLIPAALLRARIVSWIPLALIACDLIIISRFTDSTTPSSPLWWLDPLITITAYGWLAYGIARYQPTDQSPPVGAPVPPEPIQA